MKNFLALALIALAHCSFAQTLREDADTLLRQEMQEQNMVGLCAAVSVGGKQIYSGSFGPADRTSGVTLTADTPLAVGSMGTVFASLAALVLAERGQIDLDSPLPECTPARITLRQVLSHTSGLDDFRDDPKFDPDTTNYAELMKLVKMTGPQPLTPFSYSDTNYLILTHAIERVTKLSIGDAVTSLVFKPLGMSHSVAGINLSKAKGYEMTDDGLHPTSGSLFEIAPLTSQHFVTTLNDMVLFDRALDGRKILKVSTWQLATRAVTTKEGQEPFGLGFDVLNDGPIHFLGRDGEINGFSAVYVHYPDTRMSVILLSNTSGIALSATSKSLAELAQASLDLGS